MVMFALGQKVRTNWCSIWRMQSGYLHSKFQDEREKRERDLDMNGVGEDKARL